MKQSGRKIYRTANGKNVDLDMLISRNELVPAVGNAKVNARGDELGPGGKIVRKKEDILKDYYEQSTGVRNEVVKKAPTAPTVDEASQPTPEELVEWQEDEEGNFIKKHKGKR
jgi:hypothetical protein